MFLYLAKKLVSSRLRRSIHTELRVVFSSMPIQTSKLPRLAAESLCCVRLRSVCLLARRHSTCLACTIVLFHHIWNQGYAVTSMERDHRMAPPKPSIRKSYPEPNRNVSSVIRLADLLEVEVAARRLYRTNCKHWPAPDSRQVYHIAHIKIIHQNDYSVP